jgi:hypothetical protein
VLNSLPQDKQKVFRQTISPQVMQELAGELASLSYLENTVNLLLSQQDDRATTQRQLLDQTSTDITAAITKIKSLDVNALVKLDMQSVQQYKVAAALRQKISSLA